MSSATDGGRVPDTPAPGEPRVVTDLPGPKSRAILERQAPMLYPGLAHDLGPFVVARKEGITVEDVDGNVFWDFISAMASVPLGSARPDITDAAVEAMRRYGMEDTHFYTHEYVLPLAERLLAAAPTNLTRVDIALNGTEAVETAVRFMRRASGRPIVIGFMGGYHGEAGTAGAVGAETGDLSYGYRALMPGFVHVPYPNPYRTPFTARPGGSGDGTVDYLRDHLLFHAIDPREVAGFLIEPVMGSGGCVAPPDEFWTALVALCRELDLLLCVDEVKTGFGRTGELFAVQRWGVEPDLMALGKSMGGGVMPIGAVLGTERSMGFDDVSTGSTWSWLPAACAAALETLAIFEREPVLEHVRELERVAREALRPVWDRYECIGDVRVVGCFIAVEFVRDRATKERDPEFQEAVAWACARRGLLADSSTTSLNLQPSLVTPLDVMERAVGILDGAISAVLAGRPEMVEPVDLAELAGELNHPEGVAWNPSDGRVYAGGEGGEIYAVTLEGEVTEVARTGGSMLGLAVDGRGRVYACDAGNGEVVRWDPAGGLEVVARGPGGDELDTPNMLAFDPRGALYVTCSGEDGSPSVMQVVAGTEPEVWLDGFLEYPNGCAVSADGRILFVVDSHGMSVFAIAIEEDGSAGAPQSVASLPDTDADGVALDAEGALWVTLYRPDGIVRIGPDGAVETVVDDHLARVLDAPTNLAFVGPELDRAVVANVGDRFLSIGDLGVRGQALHYPDVG